jgi:hypothetical protein
VVHPLLFRGQKYHAEHFNCYHCEKKLDHLAKEFAGELYCFSDYQKLMARLCFSCKKPIFGVPVSAMGKVYHPQHFLCEKCDSPFNGSKHYEFEGKAYCELHFKIVTGAICQYCRRPVKGAGKYWNNKRN